MFAQHRPRNADLAAGLAVSQGGPGSRSRGYAGNVPVPMGGAALPESTAAIDSDDEEYSPAASTEDSAPPQQNGKRGASLETPFQATAREVHARNAHAPPQPHTLFGMSALPDNLQALDAAPRQLAEWGTRNGVNPGANADQLEAALLAGANPLLMAQLQAGVGLPPSPSPTFAPGSRVAKLAAAAEHVTNTQQVRHVLARAFLRGIPERRASVIYSLPERACWNSKYLFRAGR